jgi:hypothetical protein
VPAAGLEPALPCETLPAATSVMQVPVCCVNNVSTAEKGGDKGPARDKEKRE